MKLIVPRGMMRLARGRGAAGGQGVDRGAAAGGDGAVARAGDEAFLDGEEVAVVVPFQFAQLEEVLTREWNLLVVKVDHHVAKRRLK